MPQELPLNQPKATDAAQSNFKPFQGSAADWTGYTFVEKVTAAGTQRHVVIPGDSEQKMGCCPQCGLPAEVTSAYAKDGSRRYHQCNGHTSKSTKIRFEGCRRRFVSINFITTLGTSGRIDD